MDGLFFAVNLKLVIACVLLGYCAAIPTLFSNHTRHGLMNNWQKEVTSKAAKGRDYVALGGQSFQRTVPRHDFWWVDGPHYEDKTWYQCHSCIAGGHISEGFESCQYWEAHVDADLAAKVETLQ
jgi:hypothetical protein